MSYIKLINKLLPMGPDQTSQLLKKFPDNEAQNSRMAHVTAIVNDMCDIAHYELDASATLTLPVNTNKGIIDVVNFDTLFPLPPGSPIVITLTNNPILNIANRDNVYLQLTPYYSPAFDDYFVPYLSAFGFLDGLNIAIYPVLQGGANEGQGVFYIYYEIKYIG